MRGKAGTDQQRRLGNRITPAYAGKSKAGNENKFSFQDHPRLCGEKALSVDVHSSMTGSPPPMRGKVEKKYGKDGAKEDHPRLCGEKQTEQRHFAKYAGSPPPMRGKVLFDTDAAYGVRITPAYAGKSCTVFCGFSCFRDHPRLCGEKS